MNVKKKFIWGTVILFLLIFSFSLYSQTSRTGVITGSVINEDGVTMPGVKLSISSSSLITKRIIRVSSENGFFRFAYLPPGQYTLTVELENFTKQIIKKITVRIGMTTNIPIKMTLKRLEEVVIIEGKAPVAALENTKMSSVFAKNILEHIPISRSLESIMSLAPGVTQDNSSLGGATAGNSMNVDGVFMNDPYYQSSEPKTNMISHSLDVYEEVQIETGGHQAEYGNATGAIVNSVIKSGGNNISGSLSLYFQNKALQSSNIEGTGLEEAPVENQYRYETSFTIGGPIIKNKLWFFGAATYKPNKDKREGFPIDIKTEAFMPMLKLTFQPHKKHRFGLSLTYNDVKYPYYGASLFKEPDATQERRQKNLTAILNWLFMVSDNTILHFRGAIVSDQNTQLAYSHEPLYWDFTTKLWTNGNYDYWRDRERLIGMGTLTQYLDGFLGDHAIKAGFEIDNAGLEFKDSWGADEYGMTMYITGGGGTPYYAYSYDPPVSELQVSDYLQYSAFIQDSWKVSKRFHINAGLRWSQIKNRIPKQTNVPETLVIAKWDDFEPRIGFSYDPTGEGKTAIRFHFGRYTAAPHVWFEYYMNPNRSSYSAYRWYGEDNFSSQPWFGVEYEPDFDMISSDLKRPHTDEYLLTIEHDFGNSLSVDINYTKRKFRNEIVNINPGLVPYYEAIELENPLTGQMITYYDLIEDLPDDVNSKKMFANHDKAYRDYDAVIVGVRKFFKNRNFLMFSYTWSRAYGSVLIHGDPIWGRGGVYYWDNPNATINTEGLLDNDRTHQIKLLGTFKLPKGFIFSFNYRGTSGKTYTRYMVENLNFANYNVLLEQQGSNRYPFIHYLNLRLGKTISLGNTMKLLAFVEAYNPLNWNTETSRLQQVNSSWGDRITGIQSPRRIVLGARFSF